MSSAFLPSRMRFSIDRYHKMVAADVVLLIEVSDSSLAFDLGVKRALYARHGICEYWVVDLNGHRVHVHREPLEAGYASTAVCGPTEVVSPLAFPSLQLPVRELF